MMIASAMLCGTTKNRKSRVQAWHEWWTACDPITSRFQIVNKTRLQVRHSVRLWPLMRLSRRSTPRSDLLRLLSLPYPQSDRTVLQSDRAMSSGRDALRQACSELRCLRPARIHPAITGCAPMIPRPITARTRYTDRALSNWLRLIRI